MHAAVATHAAQKARRSSMEQNLQPSPPGVVEQASGGGLSLWPKPPSAQSGAPGPRSRSLAKESDALPAAATPKTERVLATWGRAKARSTGHANLSRALKTAREMNRVMDYDNGPESHGRSSWGKSKDKWVVLPDSGFRKTWDVFQVVFLFYVAILTPLRIGFNIEVDGPGPDSTVSATWCFELVVDLYFIVDIFINFRTAFEASDRFIERRLDAIKWHYIKSWFFIDLVACLPINYVWLIVKALQGDKGGADGKANLKVIKVIRLLRLAKLLRLARLKRILKVYEEEFHGIISSCKLLSLFLFMVYVSHVIACFWYMFGAANQTTDCFPLDPEGQGCTTEVKGWVDEQFADSTIGQTAEMVPLSRRYLKSFYWAITTLSTVGYGDITPNTDAEMGYACFAELLGSMIFGIMIGSLSTMLMSGKALEEKIDNQLAELQEFMTSKNIPSKLRSKVRRYMELYYEKKSSYDEKAVLNSLPPVLAQELMEAMYKDIVDTVPLFAGLDTEIISKLCVTLRPYQALANEYVYKQGEIGKELYIILLGKVEMSRDMHRLGVLGAGSFFGDEVIRRDKNIGSGVESRPIKRERSARAVENCDLAFLTKQDVAIVARDYPTMEVRLRNLANRRAQKDADLLKKMVAQKQAKEEAEANDRFDKISTVSAMFAKPNLQDSVIDAHRMEQYQAALTIQKHVRGHQARAGGGGVMRKKLINSVLTVDSMNDGLPAIRCKLVPGDVQRVAHQAGVIKVLSEEAGGLDHTVIGWYPDGESEPTLVNLSDMRAISFGHDSLAFAAAIDPSESEDVLHELEPEWRCFSLAYDVDKIDAPASLNDQHRASPPVVDPINLGNVESLVGQSGEDAERPNECVMSFQIRPAVEDAIGADSMTVEWLTALDRMATQQLTKDGQQLYRGIDELKPKSAAEKASEINSAFTAADANGDGLLDESEIGLLLSSLDEPATAEAIASLTTAIAGEDGTIGKHEFQQWMLARSEMDPANVRSYLLLCRQRWKIQRLAKKRREEEAEQLRLLDEQNAITSGAYSPHWSPRSGGGWQVNADVMQLIESSEKRMNDAIGELNDAVAKLQASQASTNDEILHRLRDLDSKI